VGCQDSTHKVRLLVVATHPIQYHAPLYRQLAQSDIVDLRVVFLSDFGTAPSYDPGFGKQMAYDIPLTEGYKHVFLTAGRTEPASWHSIPPPTGWAELLTGYDVVQPPPYGQLATWGIVIGAVVRRTPFLMRSDTHLDTDLGRPIARRWVKRRFGSERGVMV
jgi:hypothetical protein